ncbi:MAG: hypothetical protein Q9227_002150 [Pyrenula ochraceoflavens]
MLLNDLTTRALGVLAGLTPSRETGTSLQPRAPIPLDDYIKYETPYALQGILNNIGDKGSQVPGASEGVVVASPSTENPNYFYTWTRDSALTFKYLISTYIGGNDTLEGLIHNYTSAQAKLQVLSTPSGDLSTGGLGEPKFYTNLTAFEGSWGRPQRDGPALRATTLIAYANHLVSSDQKDVAKDILWPIIQNDLTYVTNYWNETGFDLWEEVNGSSIFTTAMQQRALVEGSDFAAAIGESCPHCDAEAPQIACFLESYWWGDRSISNQNVKTDNYTRAGNDCSSILTSIHLFDAKAKCDDPGYQPCQGKALANHKAVVDSMRKSYPINEATEATEQGKPAPVGRYPEDDYYGGNPWFLCTSAAAEQLYKAIYQWDATGSVVVHQVSQAFFNDLLPGIKVGTYEKSSETFKQVTDAVKVYADGFADLVQAHEHQNGSLSEQFSQENGTAISARDLTWSYAAFNTMAMARAGGKALDRETWGSTKVKAPDVCKRESATGTYVTPTATIFPSSSSNAGSATTTGTAASGSPSSGAGARPRPFKLWL